MKKRIVSLLLALVMAVSLLPVSAFAVDNTISNAGTGTNLGNCTYEGESYPVYKISLDETYDIGRGSSHPLPRIGASSTDIIPYQFFARITAPCYPRAGESPVPAWGGCSKNWPILIIFLC